MDNVRNDVAEIINPSKPIEVGDIVKITGTKYYSGKAIPQWVLELNWVVSKIKGDRVVIDKSEDGKYSICSPIHACDLQVIDHPQPWVPKIGDVVYYNGSVHYTNPNALVPKLCKNGLATITNISGLGTSKHPYHLKYVSGKGATVYGWVNSGTFLKA